MLFVLNVAEKPSIAKEITQILSRGESKREFTSAKTNPVFSFDYTLEGSRCRMFFTSVRGHLTSIDFDSRYRNWQRTPVEELFTAPIVSFIPNDCKDIEANLVNYARRCSVIVLWLDCDKEGEAIAYEVLELCNKVNSRLKIRRAIFSAVTKRDIEYACEHLRSPNRNLAMAVEARQEIDLKIGSSMTRFMTIKYKDKIDTSAKVLSYGPCQMPTLGFIVERYNRIERFRSEEFWTIVVEIEVENSNVIFKWKRGRLFDRLAVLTLYEVCLDSPMATVANMVLRQVRRLPPLPLDTVEMNKVVSTHLKISSHDCMKLAESLYNKGFISYPRTETNVFTQNIDLLQIVRIFAAQEPFAEYANKLIQGQFAFPRGGNKNDEAHPPIHPVKMMRREEAETQQHWDLYEFIVRRFLACCSKPATGDKSVVWVDVAGERFSSSGIVIRELNWFEIYKYEKWTGKMLPTFTPRQQIMPKKIWLNKGSTTPPNFLSESSLITLMDKNGIGTDATMHEHIQKVQDRYYAIKRPDFTFIPTNLGKAICKVANQQTNQTN